MKLISAIIFGFVLLVSVCWAEDHGPFKISVKTLPIIQDGVGQNHATGAGGGLLALQRAFQGYFQGPTGKVKNTTGGNRFVDLNHTFGPATPHIYFGYDTAKDSDEWMVGDGINPRMMYGASINYKVGDSFFLIPEFTYFDYGKLPGAVSKPDSVKEWLGGIQFRFVF